MEDRATSPIPSRAQSPLQRSRAQSPISPVKRQNPLSAIAISAMKYIAGPIIGAGVYRIVQKASNYYNQQQQIKREQQNKAIYDAHNNRQGYDSVPNQYGSN